LPFAEAVAARERASASRASSPARISGTATGSMQAGGNGKLTGRSLLAPLDWHPAKSADIVSAESTSRIGPGFEGSLIVFHL